MQGFILSCKEHLLKQFLHRSLQLIFFIIKNSIWVLLHPQKWRPFIYKWQNEIYKNETFPSLAWSTEKRVYLTGITLESNVLAYLDSLESDLSTWKTAPRRQLSGLFTTPNTWTLKFVLPENSESAPWMKPILPFLWTRVLLALVLLPSSTVVFKSSILVWSSDWF